jgi:glycosyltransferase involved in cell wall biosynthesis
MRVLHLYRPQVPSTRAQSIQVVGTCHGLARLGCHVTLLADPPDEGPIPSSDDALAFYGLEPVEGFDLRIAPVRGPTARSLWFRKHALSWILGAMTRHQETSVILGRAKRYIDEYLMLPWGPPVVLEAHEVDSLLADERAAPGMHKLERRLLLEVNGLITNCEGTLRELEKAHPGILPPNIRVIHNATAPNRVRRRRPGPDKVVGYAGSLRSFKGIDVLLEAARLLPSQWTLEIAGGTEEERAALEPLPKRVRLLGDCDYTEIPDLLARWHCAVISLDDNLFGRSLTNPLKIWDYLAAGIPIVAPELPSIREVLDERSSWYTPGDAPSLARAVVDCPRSGVRHLRSWDTRAEEVMGVLTEALR